VPRSRPTRNKRSAYVPPSKPKPAPSPRWVPPLGLGLIGLGMLLILLSYVVPGFPGGNWNLLIGFALMAAGLLVLSQWR